MERNRLKPRSRTGVHGTTTILPDVARAHQPEGVGDVGDVGETDRRLDPVARRETRGTMVVAGATGGGTVATDIAHAFVRNLRVVGSTLGTRDDLERLVSFMILVPLGQAGEAGVEQLLPHPAGLVRAHPTLTSSRTRFPDTAAGTRPPARAAT
jgi:hypothetical protein